MVPQWGYLCDCHDEGMRDRWRRYFENWDGVDGIEKKAFWKSFAYTRKWLDGRSVRLFSLGMYSLCYPI